MLRLFARTATDENTMESLDEVVLKEGIDGGGECAKIKVCPELPDDVAALAAEARRANCLPAQHLEPVP